MKSISSWQTIVFGNLFSNIIFANVKLGPLIKWVAKFIEY